MTVVESNTSTHSDELLVASARDGDVDAMAALCEFYREPLLRFCYRHLGQVDEAEDATQDVLTRVVAEDRWPAGSIRAWFFRIARNHCLDLRKQRRDGRVGVGTLFAESRFPSPQTGPRTSVARRERGEQIREALSAMTAAHAEVLMLRYFDDLSRQEIAELLELPESVVKSRLFEARREMSRRLRRRSQ